MTQTALLVVLIMISPVILGIVYSFIYKDKDKEDDTN